MIHLLRNNVLIIIILFGIICISAIDQWIVGNVHEERKAQVASTTRFLAERLNNVFDGRFDSIEAVSALFVLHPETRPDDFGRFAESLMGCNPPIRAIQYADPSTRVTYVYPPKDNEVTISSPMNLLQDPQRGPYVSRAIESRRAVVQGPFSLRQGGMGVVVRLPIFDGDTFLGLAIGVYDLDALIDEAFGGIDISPYVISISNRYGAFYQSGGNAAGYVPENTRVVAADLNWNLLVDLRTEALPPVPAPRATVWLTGVAILCLSGLYVNALGNREQRLQMLVDDRTQTLKEANERLQREIAEREAAEADLRQFRSVVEHSCELMAVVDREHRYTLINRAFQDYHRVTPEEAVGLRVGDVLGDEAYEVIRPFLDSSFQGAEQFFEMRLAYPEKGLRDIEAEYYPIRDARGEVVLVAAVIRDVTSRIRHEIQIRESEERFNLAMDASRDGIFDWNLLNDETYYSPGWKSMLGYGQDDLPDTLPVWKDLTRPGDLPKMLALVADLVAGRIERFETEFRMKHRDGHWVDILARAKAVYDSDGRAVRIVGTHVDISERKRAEAALAEAHTRLSFHVVNSPLGVVEWENGTHIKTWSRQAEAIFGWKAEEVLGKTWEDFEFIHPDDAQQVAAEIGGLFDGSLSFNTIKNRNLRKDGSVVYCQWYNSPLMDEGGRVVSILSQVADVTEIKDYEERLVLAKEQAETASEAKSRFLANMSHEIRTPLNGLLGMLELVGTTDLDGEQQEYIDHALQSGRRLSRLLSDILDLSRVEAGRMTIVREPLHIRQTLETITQLFEPAVREKGLELRLDISPNLPRTLLGDATRLQQVLGNLAGNAVKFTSQGSIEIGAHPIPPARNEECRILFSVRDTGLGIGDEDMLHLFSPFFQVENTFSRNFQGAGLGLAICKRILELMGGNMTVESAVGQGSNFCFSLPFGLPVPDERTPERSDEILPVERLKILLAEDDLVSRISAVRLLEKLGHGVEAVSDGVQALKRLEEEPFDLVLMDVQMPLLDGLEATRAIRRGQAGEGRRHVPIIALTAYAMDGDRETFLAAGMNGYLAKPLEIRKFLMEAARLMNRAGSQ